MFKSVQIVLAHLARDIPSFEGAERAVDSIKPVIKSPAYTLFEYASRILKSPLTFNQIARLKKKDGLRCSQTHPIF